MNSRQKLLSCLLLVASPSFTAASGAEALPNSAALEHAAARALQVLSTTPNTDEALLELEKQMPNMGGFYLDKEGTAHVLLTAGAAEGERQTARHIGNAIANIRSRSRVRTRSPSSTVVEPARFRFSELVRFRDYATSVLTLGSVQSLDVDERANRVSVGVLTQEAVAQTQAYWAQLGLPEDALNVFIRSPIRALRTLDDEVRPVPGGYKIWTGVFAGYIECTMGYPVYSSRLGQFGFLTNAHCTPKPGVVENTSFSNGVWAIGTEKLDPPYFTREHDSRCPPGELCRYSDAVFVASSSTDFGAIAQTINYCALPSTHCSLTVNSSSPVFYPRGFASAPLLGQDFEKIGQTTGWTYGPIQEACVTMYDNGAGRYYLCQYGVAAGTDAGDSGSPVFTWDGTQNPIAGILWGGNVGDANYFVFSPFFGINEELGDMYYY
ncbi:hypothetical protein F0U60_06885 [Archangium minus]|uniref:Serine protease n=1 Tax=Archangium minus TaxID=83450 RepID=A0ABY9WJF1_9BACT|nr:hypothetical protein F0U60_06885 [Archangium minus]